VPNTCCLRFVNGGELFMHLQREGRFSEERSRFYAAELLCALEHLHAFNVRCFCAFSVVWQVFGDRISIFLPCRLFTGGNVWSPSRRRLYADPPTPRQRSETREHTTRRSTASAFRGLRANLSIQDYTGHIALCDFGLCKLNMTDSETTNTFCGTPEYLSPELLLGQGYT
jgi:serine/threonine protein kinase